MAEWLAYFALNSYFPRSTHVGRYFIFQRINSLTCACYSVDWKVTENHLSHHYSVEWKAQFHPEVVNSTLKEEYTKINFFPQHYWKFKLINKLIIRCLKFNECLKTFALFFHANETSLSKETISEWCFLSAIPNL